MGWSITLVDTWGEDIDLDCNFCFMKRVFKQSPCWENIFNQYNPEHVNDGNLIPLLDIKDNIIQITEDMNNSKDENIKDYLLKLINLVKNESRDELRNKCLATY